MPVKMRKSWLTANVCLKTPGNSIQSVGTAAQYATVNRWGLCHSTRKLSKPKRLHKKDDNYLEKHRVGFQVGMVSPMVSGLSNQSGFISALILKDKSLYFFVFSQGS